MKASGTLFFFHAMFRDPEPLDRQVDHLTPLWQVCWLGTQIVLAMLAADDGMNEHLIGCLHLPQVMPTMALLPTGFLPLFCRKLLGGRTKRSEEGGKLLLWLSLACCLSRVLMRSCRESISPSRALTCSCREPIAMMACLSPSRRVLIRLLRLFQLFVFALQRFAQDLFSLLGAVRVLHPSSCGYSSRSARHSATA